MNDNTLKTNGNNKFPRSDSQFQNGTIGTGISIIKMQFLMHLTISDPDKLHMIFLDVREAYNTL